MNDTPTRRWAGTPYGRPLSWVAVAGAAALALTACGGSSATAQKTAADGNGSASKTGTITLGDEATLTGTGAAVGVPQTNGIQMAVDEINSAGGVKIGDTTYTLKLDKLDDESKPTTGVQNIQKMLQNGDHLIVGTLSSSVVGAYLPIIKDRDDVINMVSGAVLPGLTDNKPFYRFQNAIGGLDNGVTNYILKQGWKRVGIMTDRMHAGYVKNNDNLVNSLKGKGEDVVASTQYSAGDTQYGAQLGSMLRANPDVLYFRGYATDLIRAVEQARQLGYKGPIVSSSGYTAKEIGEENGAAAMTNVFDVVAPAVDIVATSKGSYPDAVVNEAATFVKNYKAKYSEDPGLLSALAYDSVYALVAGMQKGGSATDVAKIRQGLDAITPADVQHLALPVSSDTVFPNHQALFGLTVNQWNGSAWTAKETVSATLSQ